MARHHSFTIGFYDRPIGRQADKKAYVIAERAFAKGKAEVKLLLKTGTKREIDLASERLAKLEFKLQDARLAWLGREME